MRRATTWCVVALVAILLVGCATGVPVKIAAGDLLVQVSEEFLSKAALFDKAYAEGVITKEEYVGFWAWADTTFKPAYDKAYQVWKAGESVESFRSKLEELRLDLLFLATKLARGRTQ